MTITIDMITPEYVMKYIEENNKLIDQLKMQISALEINKIILTERYDHLVFRLTSAEQRVSDLSNTIMNHFAYNKPVTPYVTPLRCDKQPTNATVSFQCDSNKLEPFSTSVPAPAPVPAPVTAPVPTPFEFKGQSDNLFRFK